MSLGLLSAYDSSDSSSSDDETAKDSFPNSKNQGPKDPSQSLVNPFKDASTSAEQGMLPKPSFLMNQVEFPVYKLRQNQVSMKTLNTTGGHDEKVIRGCGKFGLFESVPRERRQKKGMKHLTMEDTFTMVAFVRIGVPWKVFYGKRPSSSDTFR